MIEQECPAQGPRAIITKCQIQIVLWVLEVLRALVRSPLQHFLANVLATERLYA